MTSSRLDKALAQAEQNAQHWVRVCDVVAKEFGAVGAVILPLTPEFRGVWMAKSACLEEVTRKYIDDGWYLQDHRQVGADLLLTQKLFTDDDIGERRQLYQLPYYKDFLIPMGLGFAAVIELEVNGRHFGLSLQFPSDRAPLTPTERARALSIRAQIMATATVLAGAADDRIVGLVTTMSETVDTIAVFDATGALTRTAPSASEAMALDAWPMPEILEACRADPLTFRPVHRRLPRQNVVENFTILQLPQSLRHFFSENKIMVLKTQTVSDPEAKRTRLHALFDLTPAEILCVELLAQGHSPAEIAAGLGLKTSTIRQRIKDVLQKTGMSSQAKLVALYFLN